MKNKLRYLPYAALISIVAYGSFKALLTVDYAYATNPVVGSEPYSKVTAASFAAASGPSSAITLMTTTSDRSIFFVTNTLNQDIVLMLGGISNLYCGAGTYRSVDFRTNARAIPSGTLIQGYYPGASGPSGPGSFIIDGVF